MRFSFFDLNSRLASAMIYCNIGRSAYIVSGKFFCLMCMLATAATMNFRWIVYCFQLQTSGRSRSCKKAFFAHWVCKKNFRRFIGNKGASGRGTLGGNSSGGFGSVI
jgi:hypothetical protein